MSQHHASVLQQRHSHLSLVGTPSHPSPLDRLKSANRDRHSLSSILMRSDSPENSPQGGATGNITSGVCTCKSPSTTNTSSVASLNASLSSKDALHRCLTREDAMSALQQGKEKLDGRPWKDFEGEGLHNISFSSAGMLTSMVNASLLLNKSGSGVSSLSGGNSKSGLMDDYVFTDEDCFSQSWAFYNYVRDVSRPFVHTVRNPNKALCTVDSRTTEILTVNDVTEALFGVAAEDLVGRHLKEFLQFNSTLNSNAITSESFLLEDTGQVVEVAGKVVECLNGRGNRIPISIWLKNLDDIPGFDSQQPFSSDEPLKEMTSSNPLLSLIVMEPVERVTAYLLMETSSVGTIVAHNNVLPCLLECFLPTPNSIQRDSSSSSSSLDPRVICAGHSVHQYFSGLQTDSLWTQVVDEGKTVVLNVTGKKASSGLHFPCTAQMECKSHADLVKLTTATTTNEGSPRSLSDNNTLDLPLHVLDERQSYVLMTVSVFSNISGLITAHPKDLRIHSCNATLASLLFGCRQEELVGKSIQRIIPDFIPTTSGTPTTVTSSPNEGFQGLGPLPSDVLESWAEAPSLVEQPLLSPMKSSETIQADDFEVDSNGSLPRPTLHRQLHKSTGVSSSSHRHPRSLRHLKYPSGVACSRKQANSNELFLGYYTCQGRHKDGHRLPLLLAVKYVPMKPLIVDEGNELDALLVLWVGRNEESECDNSSITTPMPLQKSFQAELNKFAAFNCSVSVGSTPMSVALMRSRQISRECLSPMKHHAGTDKDNLASQIQLRFQSCSSVPEDDAGNQLPSPPVAPNSQERLLSDNPPTCPYSTEILHSSSSTAQETTSKKFVLSTVAFEMAYEMLEVIGKGAFGYVRLARRLADEMDVVVKHIRKSKLHDRHLKRISLAAAHKLAGEPYPQMENQQDTSGICTQLASINLETASLAHDFILVPNEVKMLLGLEHENIVSILEWFDAEEYYHVVMPLHGVGMDLFEFIDRNPNLDEKLASYMFRQLVDAVSYLHGLSIAHRDIKDENIIIDYEFSLKLIDFGASTYIEKGEKFRTFCGTMEFCSPEILLGCAYDCFSADIWSMGVTLYTLVFSENPFFDHEETIKAVLKPPFSVSSELLELLAWLLEPNPRSRAKAAEVLHHPWITQPVNIDDYPFEEVLPNFDFVGNVASDFRSKSSEETTGEECNLESESSSQTLHSVTPSARGDSHHVAS